MKEISFRNDVLPLKNKLFRLALRITLNREEAEDVVQDTLMKVWNSRDKWQQLESIEAYSLTIARNLSLDRIKKMDNNNGSLEEEQVERPSFHPIRANDSERQIGHREENHRRVA